MGPPAVVVAGLPSVAQYLPGRTATHLDDLPTEPFSLASAGLAVAVEVGDERTAGAVLLAAARGVGVVASIELSEPAADRFLDELTRIAEVRAGTDTDIVDLDDDHVHLLDALAEGLTVADAARRAGLSRRTAVRRLAEARLRLGASSTTEAVRIFTSRDRKS